MNVFDLRELIEATNLHNRLKQERAELKELQRQNFEQLELDHARQRNEQPQSAELIARQKVEAIKSKQAFDGYEARMSSRHKLEREQFELQYGGESLSKLEYDDRVRDMEIQHEKEIDDLKQRQESRRVEQKFEHLREHINSNPALLEQQKVVEQARQSFHEIELAKRHAEHAKQRRQLDHEFLNARAVAQRERSAILRRKEEQARERAERENKPVVDPRVAATLAVVETMRAHEKAEREHLETLERQQQQEEIQDAQPQDASKPVPPVVAEAESEQVIATEKPALTEQQVFNRKSRVTEELATMRNRGAGNFDESLENARGKAKVYADEAGQDAGLDAAARKTVENDWIPKEFAFAQDEIGRREAALHAQMKKINAHLEPDDKIFIGRDYQQLKAEDGGMYNPTLEEINAVADRLDVLFEAEQLTRQLELQHPEWLEEQAKDERETRMSEVSAKIEEHKAAEVEHQAAIEQQIPAQSKTETDERPWRDAAEAMDEIGVARDRMNKDVAALDALYDFRLKNAEERRDDPRYEDYKANAKTLHNNAIETVNAEFEREMARIDEKYGPAAEAAVESNQDQVKETRAEANESERKFPTPDERFKSELEELDKNHQQKLVGAEADYKAKLAEAEPLIEQGEYHPNRRNVLAAEYQRTVDVLNEEHRDSVRTATFNKDEDDRQRRVERSLENNPEHQAEMAEREEYEHQQVEEHDRARSEAEETEAIRAENQQEETQRSDEERQRAESGNGQGPNETDRVEEQNREDALRQEEQRQTEQAAQETQRQEERPTDDQIRQEELRKEEEMRKEAERKEEEQRQTETARAEEQQREDAQREEEARKQERDQATPVAEQELAQAEELQKAQAGAEQSNQEDAVRQDALRAEEQRKADEERKALEAIEEEKRQEQSKLDETQAAENKERDQQQKDEKQANSLLPAGEERDPEQNGRQRQDQDAAEADRKRDEVQRQQEAERKAQEDADRKVQEEAERKAKEERRAQEEERKRQETQPEKSQDDGQQQQAEAQAKAEAEAQAKAEAEAERRRLEEEERRRMEEERER